MVQQRRETDARSVEEDALGLAHGGIGLVESLEESVRVGDVDGKRLDGDPGADRLFYSSLLLPELLGPPRDEDDVVESLGGEQRRHGAADARPGSNHQERLAGSHG